MANCVFIPRTKLKVCSGSLRWRIKLQTRGLTSPMGSSVDFTEGFVDVSTVWAMVAPAGNVGINVKPYSTFDDVTINKDYTHIFVIRYRNDVSSEMFVEFDGHRYDIVSVVDPDMTKSYLVLNALETGSNSKEASKIGAIP